jgi:hypothetical protein
LNNVALVLLLCMTGAAAVALAVIGLILRDGSRRTADPVPGYRRAGLL